MSQGPGQSLHNEKHRDPQNVPWFQEKVPMVENVASYWKCSYNLKVQTSCFVGKVPTIKKHKILQKILEKIPVDESTEFLKRFLAPWEHAYG